MEYVNFKSQIQVLPNTLNDWPIEVIKNEPMLFNCDLEHARKFGGPITHDFIDKLPPELLDVPLVFDTRVHMLMKGWFPCIPGWHHDDVPRTREDGQPNYGPNQDRSEHILGLINGDTAPTEFALGECSLLTPELNEGIIYRTWHPLIEELIELGSLERFAVPSNKLISFNDRALHQGTRTVKDGWRWFGRVSRYYDSAGLPIPRRNPRANEIRRQVQVYMENPMQGW